MRTGFPPELIYAVQDLLGDYVLGGLRESGLVREADERRGVFLALEADFGV